VRQSKKRQKYYLTKKMSPTSEIKIKNIDHLGIVAGLIDEIGIVEIIGSPELMVIILSNERSKLTRDFSSY